MLCLEEVTVLCARREELEATGHKITFVVKEKLVKGLNKIREHIGEDAALFVNPDLHLFKCHGQTKTSLGKILTDTRVHQSFRRASLSGKTSPKKFKNEMGGEGLLLGATLVLAAPKAGAEDPGNDANFSQRLVYLKKERFIGDTTAADNAGALIRRASVHLPQPEGASQKINDLVAASTVVLFTKTTCGYCDTAKEVFEEMNQPFKEYQLDKLGEDEAASIRAALQEHTGIATLPIVFINGQLIGDCDALLAARDAGTLVFD